MLHDSKFAPKIGIVQQNSSFPSVGPHLLAGSCGMVSAASLVEEIAFENGWITRGQLMESAERYGKSPYGQHLKGIADGEIMLVPNQKS